MTMKQRTVYNDLLRTLCGSGWPTGEAEKVARRQVKHMTPQQLSREITRILTAALPAAHRR